MDKYARENMSTFVIVALTVWTGMNAYACWRLGSIAVAARIPVWTVWVAAAAGWASFPAGRWLRHAWPEVGGALQTASVTWLGVLLLLCTCFLLVEVATLGGFVLRGWVLKLRVVAALAAGVLSGAALVQGARDPVVSEHEVVLPGLPRERDGLRVLLVTDAHLGRQIGRDWLKRLVVQSEVLKPDLIALGGDLIDHDVELVRPLVPELSELKAPLGVWSVLGNHEVYGGARESEELMRAAGFRMLQDESVEVVPGLRLAGVKDLGVRRRSGEDLTAVRRTLEGLSAHRGKEALLYISHTPELIEEAADLGVGLMLSGHTHGGQIWPFNYLVASRYPTIAGRYEIGGMTLIVSRGAGTWGPRMRLWKPGEVCLITLRAGK